MVITHPVEVEVSLLQKKQSLNVFKKDFKPFKETAYFVHKFASAGGQHKSENFSKLFASGMTESMSTESRIVLDSPVMAGKFGAFLDLFSILNSI